METRRTKSGRDYETYDGWMIFDGFPTPHPTIGCASCGKPLESRRTFVKDSDTGLLFCKRMCIDGSWEHREDQVLNFARINCKAMGLIETR